MVHHYIHRMFRTGKRVPFGARYIISLLSQIICVDIFGAFLVDRALLFLLGSSKLRLKWFFSQLSILFLDHFHHHLRLRIRFRHSAIYFLIWIHDWFSFSYSAIPFIFLWSVFPPVLFYCGQLSFYARWSISRLEFCRPVVEYAFSWWWEGDFLCGEIQTDMLS